MKLVKATFRQIMHFDFFELTPKDITIASGGNGTGKTSLLEAVKAVFGGANDATLVRRGADAGEAVLVFDDGATLRRRFRADGGRGDLKATTRELGNVSKAQAFADSLVDPLALDPSVFLAAAPKERVKLLLQTIPMEVRPGQLAEALGESVATPELLKRAWRPGEHALVAIDALARELYDERTGVNRSAGDKAKTVQELDASGATADLGTDWTERALLVEHDLKAAEEAGAEERRKAEDEERKRIESIRAIRDDARRAAGAAYEAAVRVAAAARDRATEDADAAFIEEEKKLHAHYGAAREQALTSRAPAIAALQANLQDARTRAEQAAKARGVAETVDRLRGEAEALQARSAALTAALDGLEGLKARLCEKLPVTGLRLVDGDLQLDGVAFDRVNTAERVRIAAELALLRLGKLRLVVADGLEALEPEARAALIARFEAADVQFLGSEVTQGPFKVDTREAVRS